MTPERRPEKIDFHGFLYEQLPLTHAELLQAIQEQRQTRTHMCETESDLLSAAKELLKAYALCPHQVYSSLRFLHAPRSEADGYMKYLTRE